LDADIIKDLKRVALDADRPAYEIVEEAVREFLKVKKRKK
jgi:predicted transcriptional regulator